MLSVFDIFRIGIGPSSSHTVGPMRAAGQFARRLERDGLLERTARVLTSLYGSLGSTGRGHATEVGVMLGLLGDMPDTVDPSPWSRGSRISGTRRRFRFARVARSHFSARATSSSSANSRCPNTPTRCCSRPSTATGLAEGHYFSVGGGFVVEGGAEAQATGPGIQAGGWPYPFSTGDELMARVEASGLSIPELMLANERVWRSDAEIRAGFLNIWAVMQDCVRRGLGHKGANDEPRLPGPLRVRRRAPALHRELLRRRSGESGTDPLAAMDWVNAFAMAANEENASGGRVVTAPTNGAAGVIPAVLHYYDAFTPAASEEGVATFLLTAAAIGFLYKANASISGAEVGCQGEVGVACSMAAAGLAAALGGTARQIENAAEIGMEHNLGLTCDPVGGLVQIPCIECNAMGAVKAINATRMALCVDGSHYVSLDTVIETIRQTGEDMKSKYKETSLGGLAVNVVEC